MKYNKHNEDYEHGCGKLVIIPSKKKHRLRIEELEPEASPQLLDVLFTGYKPSWNMSTFNEYTPEMEQDIRDIIRLMPRSMHCLLLSDLGHMPFTVALMNPNIPIHIVKLLMDNMKDAELKLKPHILSGLRELHADGKLSDERFVALRDLFISYGWREEEAAAAAAE